MEGTRKPVNTNRLASIKRPVSTNRLVRTNRLAKTNKPVPGTLTKARIHRCNICQLTYSTTSSFQKHVKRHEVDKPHECQDCDKKFVTKSGLNIHRKKHTGERPYKCENCPKAFTTRSVLIMHMRSHTGEKPYECKVCGARFTQSSTRADHMRRHTGEEQYQCTTCQKKFVTRLGYRTHTAVCQRKSKFVCKICNKICPNTHSLEIHTKTHSGKKTLECKVCGMRLSSKQSLSSHVRLKHSNEKPFKCDMCMKSYPLKSALTHHIKIHFNTNRVKCDKCGRRFTNRRIHSHQALCCKKVLAFKKFMCIMCGRQVSSKETVQKHVKKCYSRELQVSFLCNFCHQEFGTYKALVTHLLKHAKPQGLDYGNLLYKMSAYHEYCNPALVVQKYNELQNHCLSVTDRQKLERYFANNSIGICQVTSSPGIHVPALDSNRIAGEDNQGANDGNYRIPIGNHGTALFTDKIQPLTISNLSNHRTRIINNGIAVHPDQTCNQIQVTNAAKQHQDDNVKENFTNVASGPQVNHLSVHYQVVNVKEMVVEDQYLMRASESLVNKKGVILLENIPDKKDIICSTSKIHCNKTNMNDKLHKYENRKYLGNLEANYNNLDTTCIYKSAKWEACQDLDNQCSKTGKQNCIDDNQSAYDNYDREVNKHICVMQRNYPMIEEMQEMCIKEEKVFENVNKYLEEMSEMTMPNLQLVENTSLLSVNGITTIKCELP
ncbi:uncharacterized protein [Procambarus clarkii]|uniref:uncharacterized protein isoform X1 n=1 Tax=Procambarus clarkii TaxID=6728 RepID=UPI003741F28F